MKKLTLTVPKYRLAVQFKLIKRRRSGVEEPLIPSVKTLRSKYRVGRLPSRFLRHIFEHKKIKGFLGTNIALMLVATTFMPTNSLGKTGSLADVSASEITVVNGTQNPIKTIVARQYPTSQVKITQGYKFYHPGLDLDGVTGDVIKPIEKGVVKSISRSKFAYGNSVIVDHGSGITSLYAHLSKIYVVEKQEVTTETKLGEMGATGRAFGDHLHLEIRDHEIPVNPLTVLPK